MKIWVLNPPYFPNFSRPQRSPAVTKSGTLYYPIWLAYAVGVLEASGHDVEFTDAPARQLTWEAVRDRARELNPSLVVMDTSTPSIENDLRMAAALRERLPQAFVLLVGTHVSALPEEALAACPAVDAVARREYEYTVRDVANLLAERQGAPLSGRDMASIAGLSFRSERGITHNPDRAPIEDLDSLPWVSKVYRKHLRIGDYFNPNAIPPMVTLVTSRGCPFRCSFCVYPQTLMGRKYRFRGIADVVGEIEFVLREFPDAKSLFLEDDTLTANRKRCLEFADALLARGITIPWVANSRADLDFETLSRIKAAGCRELCVGFESGDQQILDSMHKGVKVERMLPFMRDARKAGVLIHGCFMFGFPGETRESARKTLELALSLKPDTAQFYPVMVYPGTEAYEEYKAKGWLTTDSYRQWLTADGLHNCVVRNESMTSAELVQLCDLARRRFYLSPRYVGYKLRQAFRSPEDFRRTAKAGLVFARHLLRGSRV